MATTLSLYFAPCKRCNLRSRFRTGFVDCLDSRAVSGPLNRMFHSARSSTKSLCTLAYRCSSDRGYVFRQTRERTLATQVKSEFIVCSNDSETKSKPEHVSSHSDLSQNETHQHTAPIFTTKPKKATIIKERQDKWIKPEGYNTGVTIYNTQTKRKEPLIAPKGQVITWYSCGPTVYDHAHLGHASSYVRTDLIRRILTQFFNLDVVFVMGVTDIDDKIITKSNEMNCSFADTAKLYEREFFNDMDLLHVIPPQVKTHVTSYIPQIIKFIQRIMDNKCAYRTHTGNVYFDVTQYGRYGRLCLHSMDAEIRGAIDTEKRHARDFALWKAAKPQEPAWNSPWGKGRPGWHIECSAMAGSMFGEKLDIHSGGDDLIFPHHENEMAQSEACFSCHQWTNYWLHTGYLHQKHEKTKMSKSLKNTIRISSMLEKYSANQFRLFCMLSPYRNIIEYSEETMLKAVRVYSNWCSLLNTGEAYVQGRLHCGPLDEQGLLTCLENVKVRVEQSLRDDFDMPRTVLALEDLVHFTNKELARPVANVGDVGCRSPSTIAAITNYIVRMMSVFGMNLSRDQLVKQNLGDNKFHQLIEDVVAFRHEVRQFALQPASQGYHLSEVKEDSANSVKPAVAKPLLESCDRLRRDMREQGIDIQDRKGESTWFPSLKMNPETPA